MGRCSVSHVAAGLLAAACLAWVAEAGVQSMKLGPATGAATRGIISVSETTRVQDVVNHTVAYFGCGCFWHVQNAFVEGLEERLLHREGLGLTAFAGYAGGSSVGEEGRVCYHSLLGTADYGRMGHAEVVSLLLPHDGIATAAGVFLDDICKGGLRQDSQDMGAEYRSLVGFAGGIESKAGATFAQEASKRGVVVKAGMGSDADEQGTIYVMDTAKFPFHQAELYHQFHDDMIETYSNEYHLLKYPLVKAGSLKTTGCPGDKGLPW